MQEHPLPNVLITVDSRRREQCARVCALRHSKIVVEKGRSVVCARVLHGESHSGLTISARTRY